MRRKISLVLLLSFLVFQTNLFAQSYAGKAVDNKTNFHAGRWVAWSAKPALAWEDAFVTGNGCHGSMMTGSAGKERIICVHEELFLRAWDRNKIAVANIAGLLPQVRALVDSDKLTKAAQLATTEARKQLVQMGAPQAWSISPHPAFDLNFDVQHSGNITAYRRQLNLETGEAQSSWKDDNGTVEQSVFSSRIHNVNVVRIKGIGRKLSVTLSLDETPGRSGDIDGVDIGKAFSSVKSGAEESGWLTYHAQYANDSGGYEGLARVVTKGGQLSVVNKRLQINNAEEIVLLIRITPLQYGATTQQAFVHNELQQLTVNYDQLLALHARQHGEMFRRVMLDLGVAKQWTSTPTETMLAEAHQKGITPLFLEQMHAMGRYLLISTSGKYPPPLQGIWGGGWKPAWIGGFVFDSNVNLAISAISKGDLTECAESYFGYVERLLPAWRLNATNYLGCRGFLVPHYSDPEKGFLNHFGAGFPWMDWPSGAGWNLMPFYEHAMITGDTNFLRQRVLPLYLEMAQFYEDYLTKEKDGYYHISPGISPENNVAENETNLAKDCTIDIAVAREVFEHLLKMGKLFNLDQADMEKWKAYYDNIIPYRINADGALAEWAPANYPDNYSHRHNSHLYPIFPGTEFLQKGSNPQLLEAARVALAKRFKYDTESAHGLIHVALMAARLHDSKMIATNLTRFAQRNYVYSGLVTSHNPNHAIYNLDAVLSLQRLLSDMVVFSQPGRIELLPACPTDFPTGQLSGLRIHGGHKLDISWNNGQLRSATVYAGKNDQCEFIYEGKVKTIRLVAGLSYILDKNLNVMEKKTSIK
jgi:alpha-L-fucosidase 2